MPLTPKSHRRAPRALLVAGAIALMTASGLGAAAPAGAATVCTGDICVVVPDTLQTPLGPATVSVSDTNAVTVAVAPSGPNTLVVGLPFTLQRPGCPGGCGLPGCPGGCTMPGCPGGCSRTNIALVTTAGVVNVDTIVFPPGPPTRFVLPNLVIVTLAHPPSPCRVATLGTTVVFTPIGVPAPGV